MCVHLILLHAILPFHSSGIRNATVVEPDSDGSVTDGPVPEGVLDLGDVSSSGTCELSRGSELEQG